MLSHTRNRQSRWIKDTEAFESEAATAPMAKAKPNSVSDSVSLTQIVGMYPSSGPNALRNMFHFTYFIYYKVLALKFGGFH